MSHAVLAQYLRDVDERALQNLMQLPVARRLDAIAEGLKLLVEHVTTLTGDLVYLSEAGRPRGARMIEAQAQEEAAKVLILLDLVRLGWSDDLKVKRQVGHFYHHLARCIYAELATCRPADFAEVRWIVEDMRQKYYLDGPNDVDWIFRNELLSSREECLYVDYVQYEDAAAWVTPARWDVLGTRTHLGVQELIMSLHRLGATSRHGLEALADAWAGQVIADSTHWTVVEDLNRRLLAQLHSDGVTLPDATGADAGRAIQHWTFPLHSLEMGVLDVKIKELQERRERRLSAQNW